MCPPSNHGPQSLRIVTQQSNSCKSTCGLTSRNSRFGDCGHGTGELTSNDPTLRDVLGARMMKISASARPPSGAKRADGFPAGDWGLLSPALATAINYEF